MLMITNILYTESVIFQFSNYIILQHAQLKRISIRQTVMNLVFEVWESTSLGSRGVRGTTVIQL